MAAQFMDKGDAAAVEPAEGTVKITFFEKGNTVDSSIEGIASRMQFDGCFAIDEYMIQRKDGTPVDAGFGADFNDAGGSGGVVGMVLAPRERSSEGEIRRAFQWHVRRRRPAHGHSYG